MERGEISARGTHNAIIRSSQEWSLVEWLKILIVDNRRGQQLLK